MLVWRLVQVETTLADYKQRPNRIVGKLLIRRTHHCPSTRAAIGKYELPVPPQAAFRRNSGCPRGWTARARPKTSLRLRHLVASHWLAARPTTSIRATGTRSVLPILPPVRVELDDRGKRVLRLRDGQWW